MAALARANDISQVIVPAVNAAEAALIPDLDVFGAEQLAQLVNHLTGLAKIEPCEIDLSGSLTEGLEYAADFADIMGQEHVKRSMEVSSAGGHNAILSGPPGAGKTLIAKSMPSILPTMTVDESLEVTKIYSVANQLPADTPLIRHRPFRSPHHTISYAGLVGGGAWPRPGEISLAHRGVLFLDELPEFSERLLEVPRQPLEGKPRESTLHKGAP